MLEKLKDFLTSQHMDSYDEERILDELWEHRKDILKETLETALKNHLMIRKIAKDSQLLFKDLSIHIDDEKVPLDRSMEKVLSQNSFQDRLIKRFEIFLKENPILSELVNKDIREILNDLIFLCGYYTYLDRKSLPLAVTQKIDFVCDILTLSASTIGVLSFEAFFTQHDRLRKSSNKLKNRKAKNKQLVLETYYRSDRITEDMKPHRIAKIIRGLLEKNMKLSLSLDTIKRYLKEEGLV